MGSQTDLSGSALTTDDSIEQFIAALFESAIGRDLYGIAIGRDLKVLDPLFSVEDYPQTPDHWYRTAESGWKQAGPVLFEAWRLACASLGGSEFIVVWERPGNDELTPDDMQWASTMFELARSPGPMLRAQVLVHSQGVRLINPEDLLGVPENRAGVLT